MPSLIGQYSDSPEEIPISSPDAPIQVPSQEPAKDIKESKNITKYVYVVIGVVVLAIVYFVFFSGGQQEIDTTINTGLNNTGSNVKANSSSEGNNPLLENNSFVELNGNGKCDPLENCFDNPGDCKCKSDEYCSGSKECIKPTCGNKICEADGMESPENCCTDCTCVVAGQICNNVTKACETAAMNLTKEQALDAIKSYFSSQNQEIDLNLTEARDISTYNDTMVWRVKVRLIGEDFSRLFGVTESKEVVDFHTI